MIPSPSPDAAAEPRPVQAVRWMLANAARRGHTYLPTPVLHAMLAGHRVTPPEEAVARSLIAGAAVVPTEGAVALPALAAAEDRLAGLLRPRLRSPGLLTVVAAGPETDAERRWAAGHEWQLGAAYRDGSPGLGRTDASAEDTSARNAEETLDVEDADALDVEAFADLIEDVHDGAGLALVGDPEAMPPSGPGSPFRDVCGSGLVAVTNVPGPDTVLGRLVTAVRSGRLPEIDPQDHEVVVTPTPDAGIKDRVLRLVERSIPSAFGVNPGEVLVATVRTSGALGAEALAAALGRPVTTIAGVRGSRHPAVVLVLPGEAAGWVDRGVVVSGMALAEQHLSVVTGLGAALRDAVARPARPRWTRLPALLAGG